MPRAACLIVCALALVVVGCTDDGDQADGPAPAILDLPTPEPVVAGEPTPTPQPEGRIIDEPFLLEVEECFNTYDFYIARLDETRRITTVVDCRRPHEGEVYASYTHPAEAAAPFPGSSDLQDWANVQCLQAFEEFIGTPYVLSALEIGAFRPTAGDWEGDGRDAPLRTITCYVYAPGAQLSGPMMGSGL